MRFHPSHYLETSNPETAHFRRGQHAFPAVGWKVIRESLNGSLTSVLYLVKDRGNHSCYFTCADVSYFVLSGFTFTLLWLHGIGAWLYVQILSPLSLHLLVCIS